MSNPLVVSGEQLATLANECNVKFAELEGRIKELEAIKALKTPKATPKQETKKAA